MPNNYKLYVLTVFAFISLQLHASDGNKVSITPTGRVLMDAAAVNCSDKLKGGVYFYEAWSKSKYPQIETCYSPRYTEANSMYTLWNDNDILTNSSLCLNVFLLFLSSMYQDYYNMR